MGLALHQGGIAPLLGIFHEPAALDEAGLAAPRDVAVLGYDDRIKSDSSDLRPAENAQRAPMPVSPKASTIAAARSFSAFQRDG